MPRHTHNCAIHIWENSEILFFLTSQTEKMPEKIILKNNVFEKVIKALKQAFNEWDFSSIPIT